MGVCVRSRFGLCQGPTTRHISDLSLVAKIGNATAQTQLVTFCFSPSVGALKVRIIGPWYLTTLDTRASHGQFIHSATMASDPQL